MRLTQGTFSHLPPLSDGEIEAQIAYCLRQGYAVSIETTDDPHPRNVYWEMWGLPVFEATTSEPILHSLGECRRAFPERYVKLSAFDSRHGRQTVALSFIVQRPPVEPELSLDRSEEGGRTIRYAIRRRNAGRSAEIPPPAGNGGRE